MVTHTALKKVAIASLKSAWEEFEELGPLFLEDQFRHIVLNELHKNSSIGGKFTAGAKYPKIVLEFMWKSGGSKMDIAVLSISTKGKTSRYSYPKSNPQPLAIELKVKGAKAPIQSDINRVKGFLKPGGKSTFLNGMILVGCKTDYRPSPAMISSTSTGLLFGCVKDNGEPFVCWLNKPAVKAGKKKKKKKKKKAGDANRKIPYLCKARWKSDGKVCQKECGGSRTSYCGYHTKPKNRK